MTPTRSDAPGPTPEALAKTVPTEANDTSAADYVASLFDDAIRRNEHTDIDQARAILDSDPDILERLWQKVDDLAKHRRIDPELRADILRVAEQIDPALAEQLERELDLAAPAVVLAAHEDELVPNRPTVGAFPPADNITAPSIEDWFREDPTRLRGLVLEASRFTTDEKLVVEGVLELAFRIGIDRQLAVDVTTHALIDSRTRRSEAVAK